MTIAGRVLATPVRLYRRWISPWKPAMCRFSPTCSQYAIEAFERHGVLRGGAYATWRILRCHPFCTGGHDPVPPAR
ncbi:MAG: membrane protein insertion efficiency factor YidD [Planctomycetota bacterium]